MFGKIRLYGFRLLSLIPILPATYYTVTLDPLASNSEATVVLAAYGMFLSACFGVFIVSLLPSVKCLIAGTTRSL